jgi:hypothetical protein
MGVARQRTQVAFVLISSTGATEDAAFAAIQRGPAEQLMLRPVLL